MTEQTTEKKTIAHRSIETQVILDYLLEHKDDPLLNYADLTAAAGRDVRHKANGSLYSARRAAQSEHGIVFGTVRGEGLMKLDNPGILVAAKADTKKAHGAGLRAVRKLEKVTYDDLDNGGKIEFNTLRSLSGALVQFTQPKAMKQIAAQVEKMQKVLPTAKMLELFQ